MSEVELEGKAQPPMANGEVVFEAPWQGRVFGMARGLNLAGHFEWDEFRDALIERIDAAERRASEPFEYYACFLQALEQILASKGLLEPEQLEKRSRAFFERPHGHDH